MVNGLIEGTIGYLFLSGGVKHAFASDVKNIVEIKHNYVKYLNVGGEEKMICYIVRGGTITII